MRNYKMSYRSRRGVSRFHVSVPYETEPEPNGVYWREKLDAALEEIAKYDALVAIWESGLIPQRATFKDHALMAIRLAKCPSEVITAADIL